MRLQRCASKKEAPDLERLLDELREGSTGPLTLSESILFSDIHSGAETLIHAALTESGRMLLNHALTPAVGL